MSEEQSSTEANQGNQGGAGPTPSFPSLPSVKSPVVHLMVTGVQAKEGPTFIRHGVSVVGLEIMPRVRVESVLSFALNIVRGTGARLPQKSVLIWSDAHAPVSEWLSVDDGAPIYLTPEQATDLLMIFDRAIRLAGYSVPTKHTEDPKAAAPDLVPLVSLVGDEKAVVP